jgi:hypothetical protein
LEQSLTESQRFSLLICGMKEERSMHGIKILAKIEENSEVAK